MSATSLAESSFEPGQTLLEKYRIERVIGTGGMGVVLLAVHLQLDERVAIKVLRDDIRVVDEVRQRFLREAQAAVKLKSENVARILDVGTLDSGSPYMVMEFLEGEDLDALILKHGKLDPGLACDLVVQACVGLAEAHARGIVHRDVKPSNLFVTWRADQTPLVKVLDFGISKTPSGADVRITQTQSVLGTPAYMSPEQMRSTRDVDARTDIWSLGMVLYEAIEGRLPFAGENFLEIALRVTSDPIPPLETAVAPELERALMACLQKERDQRLGSMYEVAVALSPFCRDAAHAQVSVDRIAGFLGRASRPLTPVPGVLTLPGPIARPTPAPTGPITEVTSPAPSPEPDRSSRRVVGAALAGLTVAVAALVAFKLIGSEPTASPVASAAPSDIVVVMPPEPSDVVTTPVDASAAVAPPAVIDAGIVAELPDASITPDASPPDAAQSTAEATKRVRKVRGSGSSGSGSGKPVDAGSGSAATEPPDPFDRFKANEGR